MRLINIGCSFSYGNCISEYETFSDKHVSPGTIVAEHLGCEEVNLASPGLSLDGVLRRLHSFNFERQDKFLIGLPPNVRMQYVSKVPRNQNKIRQSDPSGKGASEYRNNAFNRGPKIPQDWFKTMRWDLDFTHKKIDVVETTAYWSYFYITLIQQTMKHMLSTHGWQQRYWLYNSVHGHMQQESDIPEVQQLQDRIVLDTYYQPTKGILDLSSTTSKYRVAHDDTHPNHTCYHAWAKDFIEWTERESSSVY